MIRQVADGIHVRVKQFSCDRKQNEEEIWVRGIILSTHIVAGQDGGWVTRIMVALEDGTVTDVEPDRIRHTLKCFYATLPEEVKKI